MRIRQAFQLFQQGELEQAKALCEELLTSNPQQHQALLLMSAILHRQGDVQQAISWLLRAAGLQSGDTAVQLQLAGVLRNMGATAAAAELLEPLDSNLAEVALSLAQLAWQSGRYDSALGDFTAAKERWPQHTEISLAYIRALLRLGQLDHAQHALQEAQSRWPENVEFIHLQAVACLDQGNPKLALDYLLGSSAPASPDSMTSRLLEALRYLNGNPPTELAKRNDPIERSFAWARNQSARVNWFGTNTGLLHWALQQIPEEMPADCSIVECGVFHGFSLNQIAAVTQRPIHGFDSFEGLPEEWKPGEPAGSYSTQGRIPAIAAHVRLHQGWFEDSLPGFAAQLTTPVALLHVDCDLYSSTRTVLSLLGPKLVKGSMLVFDDFLAYADYEQHEFRAAHEYFAASGQQFELVGAVLLGRAVAYQLI